MRRSLSLPGLHKEGAQSDAGGGAYNSDTGGRGLIDQAQEATPRRPSPFLPHSLP